MNLAWMPSLDVNGNTRFEADAFYGDEDGPFVWRLKPKLEDDRIVWVDDSDHELSGGKSEKFTTLLEAMRELDAANERCKEEDYNNSGT